MPDVKWYSGSASGTIAINSTLVTGGTSNRLLRNDGSRVQNSLLSDDGTNVTLASGQLLVPDGTATAPVIARSAQVSTGVWFGASQINFSLNSGAHVMAIDGAFGVRLDADWPIGWSSTGDPLGTIDLSLHRAAAANLRLGAAAANPPVAQTLSTQGASGTDIAGANFTVDVSPGTGTGAGGSYIIRTAAAGGTGSSQNAQAAALTIASTGAVTASRATGGIGYGTGAGGTVTQQTSKATGATLSTVTGTVVMNNAALAADTTVSFVLTNTAIAADDHVLLNHKKTGTIGAYTFHAEPAAGSVTIYVRNVTAGSLSEAIEIQFAVFKAVTS